MSGGKANPAALQRFLAQQDLDLLQQEPLVFEKNESGAARYYQNWGCLICWVTGGLTGMIWPTWVCCPGKLAAGDALELDHEKLMYVKTNNDCCCSVSTRRTTIPLEQIRGAAVEDGCCLNCAGVKMVKVEDGVTRITVAEDHVSSHSAVEAAFLADAEKAHEAILLAVRLHKQRYTAPAMQAAMR